MDFLVRCAGERQALMVAAYALPIVARGTWHSTLLYIEWLAALQRAK